MRPSRRLPQRAGDRQPLPGGLRKRSTGASKRGQQRLRAADVSCRLRPATGPSVTEQVSAQIRKALLVDWIQGRHSVDRRGGSARKLHGLGGCSRVELPRPQVQQQLIQLRSRPRPACYCRLKLRSHCDLVCQHQRHRSDRPAAPTEIHLKQLERRTVGEVRLVRRQAVGRASLRRPDFAAEAHAINANITNPSSCSSPPRPSSGRYCPILTTAAPPPAAGSEARAG